MAEYQEGRFKGSRGDSLYYREYLPSDPQAFLIFVQGYGAHCGVLHREYLALNRMDIACMVFDTATFGRSVAHPSKRSYITDFRQLSDDVHTFCEDVVARRQPSRKLPVFVGGQSMGGTAAILCGITRPDLYQGLVLTAPAVDAEPNLAWRLIVALRHVLTWLIPGVRVMPQVPLEKTTPKAEVRRALREDPLVDHEKLRVSTVYMAVDAFAFIRQHEHELSLPIWAAFDDAEKVVWHTATRRLLNSCQSQDTTIRLCPGYMHEPLLSQQGDEVVKDMGSWILQHCT